MPRVLGPWNKCVCCLLQVKQADELAQGSAGATALASDLARFSKAIALTGFVPFSTAAQVQERVLLVSSRRVIGADADIMRLTISVGCGG